MLLDIAYRVWTSRLDEAQIAQLDDLLNTTDEELEREYKEISAAKNTFEAEMREMGLG